MNALAKWALPLLLALGFVLRMFFIRDAGFATDVQTFEAWTNMLMEHGFANFYASAGFADYPPGYFYILWVVGLIFEPFRAQGFGLLALLVKMPAILADIGVGALIYAIAKRFADTRIALIAAAIYVLNPATIYISANWGQVDSIAGGLALLAVFFLLKSDDEEGGSFSRFILYAWVTLAYSLLIKPQAAVVLPLFIAFAFVDPARRQRRMMSTLIGMLGALVFTVMLVEPFHPSQPVEAIQWLLGRLASGSSVYPYNSVNAFNLWSVHDSFWQSDSKFIGFSGVGLAQSTWGLVLVISALALILWRYVTDRSKGALLEACTLSLIAFFILATRMHERYIFDGLLFSIASIPIARRYVGAAIALSITLFANLLYSLQYLSVVTNHTPGMDASNLWGPLTPVYSLIAVGTFFLLGWFYLGGAEVVEVARTTGARQDAKLTAQSPGFPMAWWTRAQNYFNPAEGLAKMQGPIDYAIMGVLGIFNFVLSYINYWYPAEKTGQCWTMAGVTKCGVFDEIYFARGAEEYLRNMRIYENTHPPLSKLLVTLSVLLNGGLAGGDNAHGWRFLDVVFGALVVMLLYVFAKRITGSTLFATIAAAFLTFDGMHFVQSRIATPEGFVVVFSLGAIYAFYRFWIASQVEERRHVEAPPAMFAFAVAASLVIGLIVTGLWWARWHDLGVAAMIVTTLYVAMGAYLLIRYVVFPSQFSSGTREQTFPDGSYALIDAQGSELTTPDGREVAGALGGKAKLEYQDGSLSILYKSDPSVTYTTPDASANYANNEIHSGDAVERGSSANLWLLVFTVALGLLISTKWYGVMGFPVSFIVLIAVWLQRVLRKKKPMLWGNPRGFRLDGALVTIAFVALTVYGMVWIPDLVRQSPDPNEIHNFNGVLDRQVSMYEYHHNLRATHPYSSQFWEWPFDYVPVAYYYQDQRPDTQKNNPAACCVEEVTSMPNPFIMWFGLLTVPLIGVLAWREKNKGYALIVLSYLLQWLPWAASPRLIFAYHFYVNIPLICLCNAIALQRLYKWAAGLGDRGRLLGGIAVASTVLIIAAAFVYFYPVLAATKLTWAAWNARMWIPKWIVGPG